MKTILTHRQLVKKLDKVFSEYIRLSRSNNGVVKCCTCGKLDLWKECDAGHYVGRLSMATRYDERNVWPQCRACNRFHEGRKDEFALFLTQKYSPAILQELNAEKHKSVFNYPFETKLKYYKEQVKALKAIAVKNGYG